MQCFFIAKKQLYRICITFIGDYVDYSFLRLTAVLSFFNTLTFIGYGSGTCTLVQGDKSSPFYLRSLYIVSEGS